MPGCELRFEVLDQLFPGIWGVVASRPQHGPLLREVCLLVSVFHANVDALVDAV